MMYAGQRRKGWPRRVAFAVALDVVFGSRKAMRYLWRYGWSPANRPAAGERTG